MRSHSEVQSKSREPSSLAATFFLGFFFFYYLNSFESLGFFRTSYQHQCKVNHCFRLENQDIKYQFRGDLILCVGIKRELNIASSSRHRLPTTRSRQHINGSRLGRNTATWPPERRGRCGDQKTKNKKKHTVFYCFIGMKYDHSTLDTFGDFFKILSIISSTLN